MGDEKIKLADLIFFNSAGIIDGGVKRKMYNNLLVAQLNSAIKSKSSSLGKRFKKGQVDKLLFSL